MTRYGFCGLKVIAGFTAALAFSTLLAFAQTDATPPSPRKGIVIWDVPAFDALPDDENGPLARYGRSIIEATYAHIGPEAVNPEARYAGNNLACANCHLHAGLKKFGLPLVAASADYPAYSSRTGTVSSIFDRVNQCLKRSMNGRPMPEDERPMQAILAYLKVLSTHIPTEATIVGAGAGSMPEMDRAADPSRGAAVYAHTCADCHRRDGLGVRRNEALPNMGYAVPPLWGPDSFNDGAGTARLITLANFVHDNMPNGTSWIAPTLAPEDAWDVAAFVLSQPRPQLAGIDRDFPDLLLKPVDAGYPPYADSFSVEQHRFGPFAPIRAEIARLRETRGEVPNPNSP
ncbi:c-type cytochrome [Ancylobacter vacuolatus]|uniref:Thiosulfate dehydrogenase n=1 Tax=Ancylobacter vacuolatus TaxID=223389 RepID=A0ABU0DLM7_9HYPH|nr:c-type cytochrome [Ancylobacter vacuolatus]MDQ0349343.1 thiosulfate dehydrogenase [Ancylobacter vacuolatus]